MTDPTSNRRSFRPTPAWLIYGLLVVEGLLLAVRKIPVVLGQREEGMDGACWGGERGRDDSGHVALVHRGPCIPAVAGAPNLPSCLMPNFRSSTYRI